METLDIYFEGRKGGEKETVMSIGASSPRPLLKVTGSEEKVLLEVPRGDYMVVADGWRGTALRGLTRLLYGPRLKVPAQHRRFSAFGKRTRFVL